MLSETSHTQEERSDMLSLICGSEVFELMGAGVGCGFQRSEPGRNTTVWSCDPNCRYKMKMF